MPRPKGARDRNYIDKRRALLQLMTEGMMRRDAIRPSLRQFAELAGVTVPTLRHYFGGRSEVVSAILEEYRRQGETRLQAVAMAPISLADSVRDYACKLIEALQAPRQVRLGDVFGVSLAEGLLDAEIGQATLRYILDPSIDVLQRRLDAHVGRGEMVACDTRAAALILLSPLLLAALHQDQMGGRECSPVDLGRLGEEICAAFLRAYAVR